jgi:S1-C subfamily serine protease
VPEDVDGVIVTNVTPTSPLYEQAVRPGSVITEINGQKVTSVAEFEKIIKSAKPGSYLRFYTVVFGPRGARPVPFFAVVQAP